MIERGSSAEQPKQTNTFGGMREETGLGDSLSVGDRDARPVSFGAADFSSSHSKDSGPKKVESKSSERALSSEMEKGNKELAKAKDLDPQVEKKKPFTMVMVRHSDDHLDHLEPWKSEIEKNLKAHPTGKVVAFVEIANGKSGFNDKLHELHDNGMSYKDAYAHANFDMFCPEDPEQREQLVAKYTKDGKFSPPEDISKFRAEAVAFVDELDNQYPGRIRLIGEAHSDALSEKDREMRKAHNEEIKKEWETLEDNSKARYKIRADLEREREDEVADLLSKELSDESVIAGVGYMGGVHTRPTHILARQRNEDGEKEFDVKRIFPDREGGTFYFPPSHSQLREQKFFPEKEITDEARENQHSMSTELWKKKRENKNAGLSPQEISRREQVYLSEMYKKGKNDTKE